MEGKHYGCITIGGGLEGPGGEGTIGSTPCWYDDTMVIMGRF